MITLLRRGATRRVSQIARTFVTTRALLNNNAAAPDPVDLLTKNDMLSLSARPPNYVDTVLDNGVLLSDKTVILSPNEEKDIIAALLLGGDAFELNLSKPDLGYKVVNNFLVEFDESSLAIFSKVHPKPEIIVIGLGGKSRLLSDKNRTYFGKLGINVEASNSRNAAKIFDLLATERPNQIAALLLPSNI